MDKVGRHIENLKSIYPQEMKFLKTTFNDNDFKQLWRYKRHFPIRMEMDKPFKENPMKKEKKKEHRVK